VLSATGATFNTSLGHRPMVSVLPQAPALKARFTFGISASAVGIYQIGRWLDSRFQRLM